MTKIMKTNEELQAMTKEELVAYAEALQNDIENQRSITSVWYSNYNSMKERIDALKCAIQSTLDLVRTDNNII